MTKPVHYHSGGFPPKAIEWDRLIPLIGPASASVARYDGTLAAIPNASVLLSPLTTREAVLSSRIEGTQATMGEVLEYEAEISSTRLSPERRDDIREILNYRRAMRHAEEMLADLPLCLRVLCESHRVLLEGVRGQGKAPGEVRRGPNWIGPPGCTIEQARFVPIEAGAPLDNSLSVWERFVNEDNAQDRLVQLALAHAEFEALHPFLDGNGRLGRMLIPLFLWQTRLIRQPMFYASAYFETHRDEYYERLMAVSRDGDWTGWCRFFLEAIRTQAEENQAKTAAILQLYSDLKPRVLDLTHSQYAIPALDWFFGRPVFRSTDFMTSSRIPAPTARRILSLLERNGILQKLSQGTGRRAAVFVFIGLLEIVEG